MNVLLEKVLCKICIRDKDQLPLFWQTGNPIGIAMSITSLSEKTKKTPTPSTERTHLHDNVCIMINLEGFWLLMDVTHKRCTTFLPRELGCCDWTGKQKGSIHYKPSSTRLKINKLLTTVRLTSTGSHTTHIVRPIWPVS